jgi:predicted transcriptional regulator
VRMTRASTTIRVTIAQRDKLRELAEARSSSMAETLDAALETLRREQFYAAMAAAEANVAANRDTFAPFIQEREAWLNANLA